MLDRIESLIAMMRRADIVSLAIRDGDQTLELRLQPYGREADQRSSVSPGGDTASCQPVRSPEMGRFRSVDLPTDRRVEAGDILGYIDIDPVRVSVIAPMDGWLGPALREDGIVVGYGDVLFTLTGAAPR
ncbi:MAG: hypothetical protein ABF893_01045 [Gluconacetobacter liquefaciens]